MGMHGSGSHPGACETCPARSTPMVEIGCEVGTNTRAGARVGTEKSPAASLLGVQCAMRLNQRHGVLERIYKTSSALPN
jgi:hypothetical protein